MVRRSSRGLSLSLAVHWHHQCPNYSFKLRVQQPKQGFKLDTTQVDILFPVCLGFLGVFMFCFTFLGVTKH